MEKEDAPVNTSTIKREFRGFVYLDFATYFRWKGFIANPDFRSTWKL
jgi:hypothetical protein